MPKTTKTKKIRKHKKRTQKGGAIDEVINLLNNLPDAGLRHYQGQRISPTSGKAQQIIHYQTSYQPVIDRAIINLRNHLLNVNTNDLDALKFQLDLINDHITNNTNIYNFGRQASELTFEEIQAPEDTERRYEGLTIDGPPKTFAHDGPPGFKHKLLYYQAMKPLVADRIEFLRRKIISKAVSNSRPAPEGKDTDEGFGDSGLSDIVASYLGGKKTRKHKGIVQTGGNKGKLRKGYKYTGKKLKNGMAEIKKVKSKK